MLAKRDPWTVIGQPSVEDEETIIDASLNRYCWLFTCCAFGCSYSTVLRLRKNQVIRHDKTLCGERVSMRHYGDLGSIETGLCCCFVCVDSNLGTLIPSFGCDRDAVECIIKELNARVASRGDAAHVQLCQQAADKATEINLKMDLITQYLASHSSEQPPSSPTVMTIDDR